MFPFEFILFGATLLGVMIFGEQYKLRVSLVGLASIVTYKLVFTDMSLLEHIQHESTLLISLFGLLVGFELMAEHFRESRLGLKAPTILPDDWKGPFMLLFMVFLLSIILDNIAAAMIGASLSKIVFKKVRIGFLAAIVAASNAGGAGSVVGDTTTTMMWMDGVDPRDVLHAFLPSTVAFLVFSVPLSIAQQRFSPIVKDEISSHHSDNAVVDYVRVGMVFLMLVGVITGNILWDLPALGLWVIILLTVKLRKHNWARVPHTALSACFLLALVLSASLMPVKQLPAASESTVFALGFISAIFDNIPLTKLALDQGGYDWGWLAYAVGFGGSMMWFGSSAGVAVNNDNPQLGNTKTFLKESWIIPVAFVCGFASLYLIGWFPHLPHK